MSDDRTVPVRGDALLRRNRVKLIDLSRDIYEGMPLWGGHQKPFMMVNQDHHQFMERYGTPIGFEAHNWLISEHTGTHTDAILEYVPGGANLDEMPLEYFYGDAICLDVSHVRHPDWITVAVLEEAERASGQEIRPGDIVLLHSGHGDRTYPTQEFVEVHTGLDRAATVWLAERGVVNIGVEPLAPDHSDDPDFCAHQVCGEYRITMTENLTNLHLLVGRRFTYFGLPLHFRRGTGSPVRAVAWLHEEE